MRVAFLHPDLGLGGAERLIVDAAKALALRGHDVTVFTSHYEPGRSFEETRDGSFRVAVHGDWLPRHIGGKLHILFAILRSLWLALCVAAASFFYRASHDVYIVDQVSAPVPILRALCPGSSVLFYCHYPDQLLAAHNSLLKKIYRAPFDIYEEMTTALAHKIVVNSRFTKGVFLSTFQLVRIFHPDPEVVYPCVTLGWQSPSAKPFSGRILFVSINRYERKKAIELAIKGFAAARAALASGPHAGAAARMHLVIAGGYDRRVGENVEHHLELKAAAAAAGLVGDGVSGATSAWDGSPDTASVLGDAFPAAPAGLGYQQAEVGEAVTFLRSLSGAQLQYLLTAATAIVYTPSNEHFGIVPLEAMAAYRPVIACSNGGPLESIADGATGHLAEPTPEAFGKAMAAVVKDSAGAAAMGVAGAARVAALFSRDALGNHLHAICCGLRGLPVPQPALPAAAAAASATSSGSSGSRKASPAPASTTTRRRKVAQ